MQGTITTTTGADGNPIITIVNAPGGTPFYYNIRDQLVKTADVNSGDVTFDYNTAGERVKKVTPTGETRYLYDDGATLLEYDGSGQTLRRYNYGYDLLSLTDVTPGTGARSDLFYLYDGLGSTSDLTNQSGGIQVSYQYDAWGNLRQTIGSSDNVKQYTGHELDAETGLLYFGARYYDPTTGNFIAQDSYTGQSNNPPSLNRYAYAFGNPLRYVSDRADSAQEWSERNQGSERSQLDPPP